MRTTFRYMEGLGRRPTAYEEATYRVQPVEHFHYRPLWNPEIELFDPKLTKVKVSDWEAYQDPDRLYYATYCYSRADWEKMFAETFAQAQRLGLWEQLDPKFRQALVEVVVPIRHAEYGNMVTLTYVGRFAFGTAIEQAATYQAYDHSGAAQLITRIAKEIEGVEPTVLTDSRDRWLNAPHLQPLRQLVEEQMAITDWAEAVVATNLCTHVILADLLYTRLGCAAAKAGGMAYSLFADHLNKFAGYANRWGTALVKFFIKENPENKAVIQSYVDAWLPGGVAAAQALASKLEKLGLDFSGEVTVDAVVRDTLRPLYESLGLVPTGV